MKKRLFIFFAVVGMCVTLRPAFAQHPAIQFPGPLMTGKGKYTVANTHSHNDYEQSNPFWTAWQEKFGSIEADIWLQDGQLLVGHDTEEIKAGRTLEEYYVKPLSLCVEKNNGHPYADTSRCLQILIDVKADSVAALNALVTLLNKYPVLEGCPAIKWVISGNRPSPGLYTSYPSFIAFDGILGQAYTPEALSRIVMMSDDLQRFTRWNGQMKLPEADKRVIEAAVTKAHEQHLPVRFWDAPDTPAAWYQLMLLHTDYINTDHIRELATFLKDLKRIK